MNLTSKRTVEPLSVQAVVQFEEADLDAAFTDQPDPDEILFYQLFSDYWLTAPVSEKLSILSRVARLAEDSSITLNLEGHTEPKEER